MSIDGRPKAPNCQKTTAPVSAGAVATNVLPFLRRSNWDYPHLRQSSRLDGLLPMGHEWIAGLPPDVRPLRLAMQYPRLVNLIALEWNNRGHRDAFPVAVFAELRGLHDHYFKAALAERVIFQEFEAIAAGLGTGK